MNTRLKHKKYKNYIRKTVSEHQLVTVNMLLQTKTFPSKRQAQATMKRLAEKNILRRFQIETGEYVYHISKKPKQFEHILLRNKFHFNLISNLKWNQRILYYKNEFSFDGVRADAFYIIKTGRNKGIKFFLEIDRATNDFDYIKYENMYKRKKWKFEWWADPEKKGKFVFPAIVVVTFRKERIHQLIYGSRLKWVVLEEGEKLEF